MNYWTLPYFAPRESLWKPKAPHEALHTASVLMDCYASHVGEHPWVEANLEIAAKVEATMEIMMEVYQAIGRVHLSSWLGIRNTSLHSREPS